MVFQMSLDAKVVNKTIKGPLTIENTREVLCKDIIFLNAYDFEEIIFNFMYQHLKYLSYLKFHLAYLLI